LPGKEAGAVNRLELRQLAEDRTVDAERLLAAGRPSGAYYLAGYAVECGLKACIAGLTNQHDFPPKVKFVQDCYTHELNKLVAAAGLKPDLDAVTAANAVLSGNWGVVQKWNEASRYEQKTLAQAQDLYDAITNNPDGVMPWIRLHW
jgi:HEPN domain-containing protein